VSREELARIRGMNENGEIKQANVASGQKFHGAPCSSMEICGR